MEQRHGALALQRARAHLGRRPGEVWPPISYEWPAERDTLVRDDGVRVTQVSAVGNHGVVDRIGQRP